MQRGYTFFKSEMKVIEGVEHFFAALVDCMRNGFLFVMTSSGGQPVGFAAVQQTSSFYTPKAATILYAFASESNSTDLAAIVQEASNWAQSLGLKQLQICVPRINGASIRLFEKRLRFRKKYLVYTRDI